MQQLLLCKPASTLPIKYLSYRRKTLPVVATSNKTTRYKHQLSFMPSPFSCESCQKWHNSRMDTDAKTRAGHATNVEHTMELTRKILIVSAAIGVVFVAFTLRTWVIDGRKSSFKKELWGSLIAIFVFAIIAGIFIYINN